MSQPFADERVERVYRSMPARFRQPALQLRDLILAVGDDLQATGGILETLKWGEPSYLPVIPRTGSTIRLAVHDEQHLGLYFNCNTSLVDSFRSMFGDELCYSKNRAVLLSVDEPLPTSLLVQCIGMGLYHHRNRKARTYPVDR